MKHYYHSSKASTGASMIQGYRELACAIVFQAVEDYRNADEVLPRKKARALRKDIEMFFKSPLFGFLCDLDPKETIQNLNRKSRRRAV